VNLSLSACGSTRMAMPDGLDEGERRALGSALCCAETTGH
jgi:hypothetical protein